MSLCGCGERERSAAVLEALRASLRKLGLGFVDLYLIHSPNVRELRVEQWGAMIEAKRAGLAKSIGVSNYGGARAPVSIQGLVGCPLPFHSRSPSGPWRAAHHLEDEEAQCAGWRPAHSRCGQFIPVVVARRGAHTSAPSSSQAASMEGRAPQPLPGGKRARV